MNPKTTITPLDTIAVQKKIVRDMERAAGMQLAKWMKTLSAEDDTLLNRLNHQLDIEWAKLRRMIRGGMADYTSSEAL